MGNRFSQHESQPEEEEPFLSSTVPSIQEDAGGYGSTATHPAVHSNGASSTGTGDITGAADARPLPRRPALKTELSTQDHVLRVPFSHRPNGGPAYGPLEGEGEEEARRSALAQRLRYHSRLDPHPHSKLAMPQHVVPDDFLVHILVPVPGQQSSLVTVFALWNTMMGTSLLSMPWAILQAGFIGGVVLLSLMALLMFYTSYLVLKSIHLEPGVTFKDFADVCLFVLGKGVVGKAARVLALFSSFISVIGGAIVYWILLSNFLYHIVLFIHNKITLPGSSNLTTFTTPHTLNYISNTSDPYPDVVCHSSDASEISNNTDVSFFHRFWTQNLTVPLLIAVPFTFLVNFKSALIFTKFNSLGVLSVLFVIVFAIDKAARWGFHLELGITTQSPDSLYVPDFKWTFPALTGIGALALFVHNCVITIMRNQKHPENNVRDLALAYLMVTLSYLFVGVVVFITFPLAKTCIQDNFLNNVASDDIFAFVAHIMLLFQMTCVLPLLLFILRVQLLTVLFGDEWPGRLHVMTLNFSMFVICILFAIFLPQIGKIIGFVGAFCGLAYSMLLPCSVHMVARYKTGRLSWTFFLCNSLIILFGAANFIAQFLVAGKTTS